MDLCVHGQWNSMNAKVQKHIGPMPCAQLEDGLIGLKKRNAGRLGVQTGPDPKCHSTICFHKENEHRHQI